MNKLAVFVEGYTESIFVEALIAHIASENNIRIEQRRIRGGSSVRRTFNVVKAAKADTGQNYYVLIVDCGGDSLVKDRIREEHENLTRNNYQKIIGLRDVRPQFSHADIPKLEAGLLKYIKTSLIPVQFILSVMEIEAWFLAEFNHYPKIDPSITLSLIKSNLGFDPQHDDMALRLKPTDDLNACYQLGGKTYEKSKADATVAALDIPFLYLELPQKIKHLKKKLVESIDAFLV